MFGMILCVFVHDHYLIQCRLDYEGSYIKKIDDDINEGEATFVRTSRFTVLSHKGIALRDLAYKVIINVYILVYINAVM